MAGGGQGVGLRQTGQTRLTGGAGLEGRLVGHGVRSGEVGWVVGVVGVRV